jgi:hypothetical protein
MWRICLLFIVTLSTAVLASERANPLDAAEARDAYCLDAPVEERERPAAVEGGGGISLSGLAATLGIGLLSLLCLIPVALLAEWLMGREKTADDSSAAWG